MSLNLHRKGLRVRHVPRFQTPEPPLPFRRPPPRQLRRPATLREAMAFRLSGHDLSVLCLGKPTLWPLSVRDTVADALAALKRIDDTYVSVWNCNHSFIRKQQPQIQFQEQCSCTCIGKVCMVDIICFLSKPQNLSSPSAALHSPISALLQDNSALLVLHLPPSASLLEAIEVMQEGVQNLVVPIKNPFESLDSNNVHHNNNTTYCWLTQENMLHYIYSSIRRFCPTARNPINTLGVIETQNFFTVCYDDPASSILDLLALSLISQSSVAIVDPNGKLSGEISPVMLNSCDESIVPAIATLSVGEFIAYINCGGPPEDLAQLVKEKVEEQNLLGRRSKAIVCYPWDCLNVVMMQALGHRVSYMWVVEEDGTLTGIVTFQGMLKVYRDDLISIHDDDDDAHNFYAAISAKCPFWLC